MLTINQLRVKLFADGADLKVIEAMAANPLIKGFTTNPTLMRKAGVTNYVAFARDALRIVPDRPISFEVFSDDFGEMESQALQIASWGPNVFVKIPITNTRRESAAPLVSRLTRAGVPCAGRPAPVRQPDDARAETLRHEPRAVRIAVGDHEDFSRRGDGLDQMIEALLEPRPAVVDGHDDRDAGIVRGRSALGVRQGFAPR